MRRVSIALLLLVLVLAVGFLAGRVSRPESNVSRAPRWQDRSVDDPTAPVDIAGVAYTEALQTECLRVGDDASALVRGADREHRPGTLLVDLRGRPDIDRVRLRGPGMTGIADHVRELPESVEQLAFVVVAGDYLVSWNERGLGERVVPASVSPGHVTSVDVGAVSGLVKGFPLAAGLGRIDVYVRGIDGAPIECATVLVVGTSMFGHAQTIVRETGPEGVSRLDLRPGAYRLRVGSRESSIVVQESAAQNVTFQHGTGGDVRVTGLPGLVRLRPVGGSKWIRAVAPGRFLFVPPGEYDVGYRGGTRAAGRIVVPSGAIVEEVLRPADGELLIDLPVALQIEARVRIQVKGVSPGADCIPAIVVEAEPWQDAVCIPNLKEGTYRIEVHAPGYQPWTFDARVGRETRRIDATILEQSD